MYALQLDLVYEADHTLKDKEPVGINNPLLYHNGLAGDTEDEARHFLSDIDAKVIGALQGKKTEAHAPHAESDLPCRGERRVIVTSIFCSENGIGLPSV